jgi:DNA-directed RNA polymerase subunit RPC12/RpoP
MIIKCPNCNGALEFDVKSGLMYCKFCGSFFTAEEVAMPETDPADTEGVSPWSPSEISDEVGNFNSGIEATQYSDARGYSTDAQRYGNFRGGAQTNDQAGAQTGYQTGTQAASQPTVQTGGTQFTVRKFDDDSRIDASGKVNLSGMTYEQQQNYVFNIPTEEREANRNRYYEEQQKLAEEYHKRPKPDYTKPFSGTTVSIRDVDLPEVDPNYNVHDYYAKQAQLSEEYNRKIENTDIDYTKPFDGTTRENMTWDQVIEANRRDREAREKMQAELDRIDKKKYLNGQYQSPRDAYGYVIEMSQIQEKYNKTVDQNAQAAQNSGAAGTAQGQPISNIYGGGYNANRPKKEYYYTKGGSRIIQNTGGVYLVTDAPPDFGAEMMDNKVYTCSTCGAELGLTGVETSSFCAYCGQPTIAFSRIEKCTKPDSIIPFGVTKDEALSLVRKRLNKGFLVPDEVKKFEVEKLCGIYIPYWLFDASYTDSLVIKSRVKQGKSTTVKNYRVNTNCNLFYFPVDASKNLNDYSSRKLDPYDYSGMRPFNVSYMSGFYSDRFDMSSDQMSMTAMYRAQSMLYEKAKTKVPGSPVGLVDSAPMFHIRKKYYTMLPAWFLSFRYEFNTYTIMINGQTGKVVGAVPYDKKKFYAVLSAAFVAASTVAIPLSIALTKAVLTSTSSSSNSGKALVLPIIVAGFFFMLGQANFKKYKKNMELAREEKMADFVRERQEV